MRLPMPIIIMILGGCVNLRVAQQAQEQDYQKNMNSWVGVSEDKLIGRWGVPTSTYDSNSTKYVTFVEVLPTIFLEVWLSPGNAKRYLA